LISSRYKFRIILIVGAVLVTLAVAGNTVNYLKMTGTMRDQVLETSTNKIKSIQTSMEMVIGVMNNALMQAALDSQLKSFSNRYELLDIFDRQDVYRRLYQLRSANKYFDKLYVYYFDDAKVIDLNGANASYLDLDRIDNRNMLVNAKSIFDQGSYFKSLFIFNLPVNESETEAAMIMPVNPADYNPKALIIMTLNKAFFRSMLTMGDETGQANVYVLDQDGQVLFGKGDSTMAVDNPGLKGRMNGSTRIDVGGTPYLASFITSGETGWKFVYEVPASVVFDKLESTKLFLIVLTLVSLVYVVVITLLAADVLHRPVKKVIRTLLRESDDGPAAIKDEIGFIERNIEHLISEKKDIQQLWEENRPFLRNAALEKLITVAPSEGDDIPGSLAHYDIRLPEDRYYGVCLLKIDRLDYSGKKYNDKQIDERLIRQREAIESCVQREPKVEAEIVHSRGNSLIVLMCIDELSEAAAERRWREVSGRISECVIGEIDVPFVIGASSLCSGMSQIHECYEQAGIACHYKVIAGANKLIRFPDMPQLNKVTYKYPFHLEEEIFNSLRQSGREAIEAAIVKYFAYARENMQSYDRIKYTFVQLLNDTMKVLSELSINSDQLFPAADIYERILSLSTLDEAQSFFQEVFDRIYDYISDQKENNQNDVAKQIETYIRQNYAKEDICLDLLAEEMHYSVSYLVKVFKHATGKSIKEFITERRIEKSMEYLASKDMKIGDIAAKIGYSDARSFINNFKKIVGMTPNLYKSRLIHEEIENKLLADGAHP